MFHKLKYSGVDGSTVSLKVDGKSVDAESGDSVASVLVRLDPPYARTTPVSGSPRSPYCMMGVCFECLAVVDGVPSTQTCLVEVKEGMRIERQNGRRAIQPISTGTDSTSGAATANDMGNGAST